MKSVMKLSHGGVTLRYDRETELKLLPSSESTYVCLTLCSTLLRK
jgi:hypothetical protein